MVTFVLEVFIKLEPSPHVLNYLITSFFSFISLYTLEHFIKDFKRVDMRMLYTEIKLVLLKNLSGVNIR